MPKYYKNKSQNRRKWRQQKLSVGTVAKIAKNVAKKLDKKNIKYYINNIPYAADGFTWDSITELVPESSYRPIANGALESQNMSDIGGYIADPAVGQIIASNNAYNLTIGVAGVQARLQFQNDNSNDVTVTSMIVFIPNLNDHTDDAVDFLRPDVFMLYKKGSGNLLYDGMAKQIIRNKATGLATVRDYTILVSKTIKLPASKYGGQQIEDAQTPAAQGTLMRDISQPSRRKVTLTKYFKRERRHNLKQNAAVGRAFTDGNYFLIIYSDLSLDANGARSISYCGASSVKFRVIGTTGAVNQ